MNVYDLAHQLAKAIQESEEFKQYKASEMRKESRGWFLREDYPETDNEHWHKWIVVQQVDGRMTLSTEDIPPERFPAPGKS